MSITLSPEMKSVLESAALASGVTPEALAADVLEKQLRRQYVKFEPRDEWERILASIGKDCGVSLTDEQLSSEGLYD